MRTHCITAVCRGYKDVHAPQALAGPCSTGLSDGFKKSADCRQDCCVGARVNPTVICKTSLTHSVNHHSVSLVSLQFSPCGAALSAWDCFLLDLGTLSEKLD